MNNWAIKSKFYDPKFRGGVFQILALVLTVGFFVWIGHNTATNLQRQGIASGFGFLSTTAGFDMTMSLIPYTEESSYGMAFIAAVVNTLLVSILGIILATILGFGIGVARLSSNWLVARLSETYIEIIRNVPLLLQLFFWYFAVLRGLPGPRNSMNVGDSIFLNIRGLYIPKPVTHAGSEWVGLSVLVGIAVIVFVFRWTKWQRLNTGRIFPIKRWLLLTPILPIATFFAVGSPLSLDVPHLQGFNFQGGVVLIPELVALLMALTFYTASFIAEIVRAGIQAIPKGQTEAALSLGLPKARALQLVIIPQALRIIIPPLTSQFLNLTKNSSLAAAIAYPDLVLVFAGTVLMQTGQAVEVILLTMAVYLVISLSISFGMNVYNRKIALVER